MSDFARQPTPGFTAYIERSKTCDKCGEESNGKGSIKLYGKTGKRLPYPWTKPVDKIVGYSAFCKSCAPEASQTLSVNSKAPHEPLPEEDEHTYVARQAILFVKHCNKRLASTPGAELSLEELLNIAKAHWKKQEDELKKLLATG